VFYDAREGQARMLGGGFIASAQSAADVAARPGAAALTATARS
jgi:hypothetical protein